MILMATSVTASLLVVLIPVVIGNDQIFAHVGDNVTLSCKAPHGVDLKHAAIEWKRPDLGPRQYVFNYRDSRPDPDEQHPSYKKRVELVYSQLKDGDLSVVLKNVMTNDSGTFECHVIQVDQRKGSWSDPGPIRKIILNVLYPSNLPLTIGLPVTVVVIVVIVVTGVALLVSRRWRDSSCSPSVVSNEDQVDQCPTVSESVDSKV